MFTLVNADEPSLSVALNVRIYVPASAKPGVQSKVELMGWPVAGSSGLVVDPGGKPTR